MEEYKNTSFYAGLFSGCLQTIVGHPFDTFKVFFKGLPFKEKVGGGDEPTMRQFVLDVVDEVFKQFREKI